MTGTAALNVRNVRCSFGAHLVLRDVSLEIHPGEIVALVGPSGAGKTTLLSLGNATLLPGEGTVTVLGAETGSLRRRRERRRVLSRVGTVQQQPQLPGSMLVVHNVNAGRLGQWSTLAALVSLVKPRGVAEVRGALDRFGIADLLRARTSTLSGGQQQRVALARLLVQKPDLVLADEPVSAVDPAWSREVLTVLAELAAQGAAVVLSIHDIDLALEQVQRVVGLRAGEIVFDCAAEQVTPEQLTALYELTA